MIAQIPTPILVTAPASEPVTLAEAKAHVSAVWDEDDTLIGTLIVAARQWFEVALDRQLVSATWLVKLRKFWAGPLYLPYPPLQSVGYVKYFDVDGVERTLASSTYNVVVSSTPGFVELAFDKFWPPLSIRPEAVSIQYTSGTDVADVPELVKAGIKLLIGHWYANRESVSFSPMLDVPHTVQSIVQAARSYRF